MDWSERWTKVRLVLVLMLLTTIGFSQSDDSTVASHGVDTAWWNKETKEVDYFEEEPARKDFEVSPNKSNFDWSKVEFLKYGVLIMIAGVIIFVLYRLYGQSMFEFTSSRKTKQLLHLVEEDLDERFLELDLAKMLKQAIAQKNWKMAIRLRFLQVLKMLVDNEQINWHPDLTNRQISYQLALGEKRTGFNELVKIYELAWYSNALVNAQFYEKVDLKFKAYLKQIVPNA